MADLTGAEILLRTLEYHGVEVVFGVPGGAILPLYDPLLDRPLRHVLARHEQGAGHMAEGYAQATGTPGVVITTSGPGATNLVTPLMNAKADSTPLVAITGQVATGAIGTDAFQEAPTTALTRPCTKRNWLVESAADLPEVLSRAFATATGGRPGPVLVDVPKDVLAASAPWRPPTDRPAVPPHPPDPAAVAAAVSLLATAHRPVVYAGGGVVHAAASAELLALAERTRTPVVTTLMGRGCFPDDHPLALGMPGMHGRYVATTALQRADLLLAVGARFDDRVTGDPATFAPRARVVHVDVDPSEIGKVRVPEVAVVGDARDVLSRMLEVWGSRPAPERARWLGTLRRWARERPLRYTQTADGPIKPQFVVEELHRLTGGEAIVVAGVGQHQMWTSQFWRFRRPRSWINSGGLGTMGFALPAAIGAKVGRPDELVYAIDGDGCFQMTMQELLTATHERIPVKLAVLNNRHYGMVKQWQELFYRGRLSSVHLGDRWPDYVGLARSMGCVALRAETPEEVETVIAASLAVDDRPVLVEFVVDPDEMLWPMVVAGGSNDRILTGPADLVAG